METGSYSLFATPYSPYSIITSGSPIFDRLAVLDEDLRHGAGARRGNLIHGLHRLDDEQRLPGGHAGADLDEGLGAGLGRPIGSADHR